MNTRNPLLRKNRWTTPVYWDLRWTKRRTLCRKTKTSGRRQLQWCQCMQRAWRRLKNPLRAASKKLPMRTSRRLLKYQASLQTTSLIRRQQCSKSRRLKLILQSKASIWSGSKHLTLRFRMSRAKFKTICNQEEILSEFLQDTTEKAIRMILKIKTPKEKKIRTVGRKRSQVQVLELVIKKKELHTRTNLERQALMKQKA